jgi:hypothetical protein
LGGKGGYQKMIHFNSNLLNTLCFSLWKTKKHCLHICN